MRYLPRRVSEQTTSFDIVNFRWDGLCQAITKKRRLEGLRKHKPRLLIGQKQHPFDLVFEELETTEKTRKEWN